MDEPLAMLAVVFVVAAAAPLLADLLSRWRVPTTVIEILLGILIGPAVLGWVDDVAIVSTLSSLGLAMLFFFAGMEVDLDRIKGPPLERAGMAWGVSLVIGLAVGGIFALFGLVMSGLIVGLCLTTTALGTLLPIVTDAGQLESRFGGFVLATGAVGEFAPIVAIALLLSGHNPALEGLLLVAFVLLALLAVGFALRPLPPRLRRVMGATLRSSGHLAVRLCVCALALMVWVASHLGLDTLLGAFTAGAVVRVCLRHSDAPEQVEVVEQKLAGLGYGFLIPFFFVASGVAFDVDALFASPTTILRVPLFLGLFLVARGLPTYLFHRGLLPARERVALALAASTALPLIVAVTTIGLDTGRMHPENAVALVGAGMLSVLLFPTIALSTVGRAEDDSAAPIRPAPAANGEWA